MRDMLVQGRELVKRSMADRYGGVVKEWEGMVDVLRDGAGHVLFARVKPDIGSCFERTSSSVFLHSTSFLVKRLTIVENKVWDFCRITLRLPVGNYKLRCIVEEGPVDSIFIAAIARTATEAGNLAPLASAGAEEAAGLDKAAA